MKIYTKNGDHGESQLYNGETRKKHDHVFEALGDVDEINSFVGLVREHCISNGIDMEDKLVYVQSRLLDVGSALATPTKGSSKDKLKRTEFDVRHARTTEEWIDEMNEQLPELTRFILPSGGLAASTLHVARVVCRRAERKVWKLVDEGHVDGNVGIYLNRLSDFFFTAARYCAMREGREEVAYKKA